MMSTQDQIKLATLRYYLNMSIGDLDKAEKVLAGMSSKPDGLDSLPGSNLNIRNVRERVDVLLDLARKGAKA